MSTEKLTDAELDAIEARANAATVGPWFWDLNRRGRQVSLCAKTHDYEYVMSFYRWGMDRATVAFQKHLRDGCGVMWKAEQFAKPVPGREHHADWFQTVDHPDSEFIAQSRADVPRLVAELRRIQKELRVLQGAQYTCNVCEKIYTGFLPPNGACAECSDYKERKL